MLITSNRAVGEWGAVLGDKGVATAILDRLLHHSHVLTEQHPDELYLALNDIEHRRRGVRRPRTNGFVERFNGTVLEELFRGKKREGSITTSRRCSQTSTTGSAATTPNVRISAIATKVEGCSKP